VDIDPSEIGHNRPADVGIVGDARLSLEAFLARISAAPDADWLDRIGQARRGARARVRGTLGPYERVLDDLRSTLPRDAIVVRDVTVPATAWGSRLLEVYEPRTAIYSASLAIGQGLPMAIGAAIGRPDRTVALLVGDGGFAVTLGELSTAVQEGLRLVTVLFNDAGYGILRNLQDSHFDGRRFAVDLTTPDYLGLAQSFGVWGRQVRSSVEMGPLLKEALQQDGPALIEVDMVAVGPMATPFTGSARLVPGR
jgi:acetolactate synthase-1/2/3 large subunit